MMVKIFFEHLMIENYVKERFHLKKEDIDQRRTIYVKTQIWMQNLDWKRNLWSFCSKFSFYLLFWMGEQDLLLSSKKQTYSFKDVVSRHDERYFIHCKWQFVVYKILWKIRRYYSDISSQNFFLKNCVF